MNHDLHRNITQRLFADFEFREQGDWFRQGRCPGCGRKELYVKADEPWVVRCGRLNNCGYSAHVKELYPDVFNNWSDRYKATDTDPNAAAAAYLRYARGLDIAALGGCFEQGAYFDHATQQGSATVRFPLPGGGWWERLIDRPERFGKKKAVFRPGTQYQGDWWLPAGLDVGACEELWITEGIFDTLSLRTVGLPSVAVLSCNNYPEAALAALAGKTGRRVRLVWALDGDRAGRGFTLKHVAKARADGWTCEAAQIPQTGKSKKDWNDQLLLGRLEPADLDEYRYQGAILLAENASEKALLIYNRTNRQQFPFDFKRRLFWFKLDIEKYNKVREQHREADATLSEADARARALAESGVVSEISNCSPRALYFQQSPLTDESWYYFQVDFPHDGPSVKGTFTGQQLTAASAFKQRLASIAGGALFFGSGAQLDRLMKDQIFNIKRVETIDFIGYSKEHGCYLFNDLAVKDGKAHPINDQDFYELGSLSIKSLNQSVQLAINQDLKEHSTAWQQSLYQAFGPRGIVALAFWMGSLFAEQIRAVQKSYPFLEMVGEPGTGKTTLIEFLWKLFGRSDYEGFDPSKSSLAARARNFAQVSGLPVVLIESDRESDTAKAGRFDWDELKTAYNGRSVRARGLKTSGNETYEPPFRGSIVIAQNAAVNASEAILSRIVHLHFDRASQTPETYAAAQQLEKISTEDVSGFILRAVQQEKTIMDLVNERSTNYMHGLLRDQPIKVARVAKNHGLLHALVDALAGLIALPEAHLAATHRLIVEMAIERQQAISADHPVVQEFWEAFDYLNAQGEERPLLDHGSRDGHICVNLNQFLELASERRQQVPPILELKRHLKASRSRRFIDQKVVKSLIWTHPEGTPKSVRCWLFARPKTR